MEVIGNACDPCHVVPLRRTQSTSVTARIWGSIRKATQHLQARRRKGTP